LEQPREGREQQPHRHCEDRSDEAIQALRDWARFAVKRFDSPCHSEVAEGNQKPGPPRDPT
jgi:hypothetical protein